MSKNIDWEDFIDDSGDFELAAYLYQSNLRLMKSALDLGTLLSSDSTRLRAYKEQIKQIFKAQWKNTAQALESFGIIEPCICTDEFCRICKGSRYRLGVTLGADEIQEFSMVVTSKEEHDPEIQKILTQGMEKAVRELKEAGLI